MLKKTITYTDFNGVERKEDFYFNFTEAELTEMQLTTEGGLDAYIQRVVDAKDQTTLIELFKDLVLKAYGVKSEDGRYFDKSDAAKERFSHSEPYSIIFMELATDDAAAAEFFNGVIPKATAKAIAEAEKANKPKVVEKD